MADPGHPAALFPHGIIARRGLWDRRARPAGTEAVVRAYRRGVVSLVGRAVLQDPAGLAQVIRTAAARGLPLLLSVRDDPRPLLRDLPTSGVTVLWLRGDEAASDCSAMLQLDGEEWQQTSVVYVRVAALRDALARGGKDGPPCLANARGLLVESVDCVTSMAGIRALGRVDDDTVDAHISAWLGSEQGGVPRVRVVDLAEMALSACREPGPGSPALDDGAQRTVTEPARRLVSLAGGDEPVCLAEAPRFRRKAAEVNWSEVRDALADAQRRFGEAEIDYFGFSEPDPATRGAFRIRSHRAQVDNFIRLAHRDNFETSPRVLTCGLRGSRFAAILFWEIYHLLAVGGTWIDIDPHVARPGGLFGVDHLQRRYFHDTLERIDDGGPGPAGQVVYRKIRPAPIAEDVREDGWSFGILTATVSETARRMVAQIVAGMRAPFEILVCGPPDPQLERLAAVTVFDLEVPEPRGWITRKKNLIAARARHGNLCLMHDRFSLSPAFFEALQRYGDVFPFYTFAQFHYPNEQRVGRLRYPDYQAFVAPHDVDRTLRTGVVQRRFIQDPDPAYEDFGEGAFCCGGIYVTKRRLWQWVPQDESLYHAEYEDVIAGLQAQRAGIPHRVNPYAEVESLTPHLLHRTTLMPLQVADPALRAEVDLEMQLARIARHPDVTHKPLINRPRVDYGRGVCADLARLPGGTPASDAWLDALARLDRFSLASFWEAVHRFLQMLVVTDRDAVQAIYGVLCRHLYPWPSAEVQRWIADKERMLVAQGNRAAGRRVVAWGSGGAFRQFHAATGADVAYVVDNDRARVGGEVCGFRIHAPTRLLDEDRNEVLVVICSSFEAEIRADLARLGRFDSCTAGELMAAEFPPLAGVIAHLRTLETIYPRQFADDPGQAPAGVAEATLDELGRAFTRGESARLRWSPPVTERDWPQDDADGRDPRYRCGGDHRRARVSPPGLIDVGG